MPESLSMPAVLTIFYMVFLSQIFLLSIYYPGQLRRRAVYVLEHFPPADYPKLYLDGRGGLAGAEKRMLAVYRAANYVIAGLGAVILLAMALTGYRPDPGGGDAIFVMLYFGLQSLPQFYVELMAFKQFRTMRKAFAATRRTAELKPRRLFDFIAPGYVAAAVLFYLAWLAFYLQAKGLGADAVWGGGVYATLALITGMNLAYIAAIVRFLRGKKLDPYKAHQDHLTHIGGVVKVFVFSSIGISLFLILTQAAHQYRLEVFGPPLVSLYLQLCAVFAIGLLFRTIRLEAVDFEVYRENGRAA